MEVIRLSVAACRPLFQPVFQMHSPLPLGPGHSSAGWAREGLVSTSQLCRRRDLGLVTCSSQAQRLGGCQEDGDGARWNPGTEQALSHAARAARWPCQTCLIPKGGSCNLACAPATQPWGRPHCPPSTHSLESQLKFPNPVTAASYRVNEGASSREQLKTCFCKGLGESGDVSCQPEKRMFLYASLTGVSPNCP